MPIAVLVRGDTFSVIPLTHTWHSTKEINVTSRRYQLIENLPYPRASRPGGLTDRSGTPLHGVYERKVETGFRAAVVNNGRVIHRYDYRASLVDKPREPTRSFANLVHTLAPWLAPDEAERPVTNYPASESAASIGWRPLWHEPIILDTMLRGTKRVGSLAGSPPDTDRWGALARADGIAVRTVRSWTAWGGAPWRLDLMVRPGILAGPDDLEALRAEYAEQLPQHRTGPVLTRLSAMTGEDLDWHRLVNPIDADDLLISGYCFGYPVASTVACILGTHG